MEKITKEKIELIAGAINDSLEENYPIAVNLVRPKIKVENYVMLFQEASLLMLEGNLSKNALKLFVYMLGKLQYSNHIGVDQETMAQENKMSLVYVKKTIRELKELNILLPYKDLQDSRRNVYVVNPTLAWRGKVKNRDKFLRDNKQLNLFDKNNPAIKPSSEF